MIKANSDAFNFIIEQLNNRYAIRNEEAKRYLSTNAREKDILKKTKILRTIKLLPSLSFIDTTYLNKRYLVILGIDLTYLDIDYDHYDRIPNNSGIFTILLSDKLLPLAQNIDGKSFENQIMYQHLDEKYSGHDFQDLENFFQPISILKIREESLLYDRNLFQIALNIISKNNSITVLNFENDALQKYIDISLTKGLKFPYELILNSLLTSKFKFCFLELYRVVERLFPISYLQEFHISSKSQLNFPEFVQELETITSWRPKEDEALKRILDNMGGGKNKILEDLTKDKGFGENLHNYIYKLRNSIVHFRMLHEEIEHNESEWNDLIFGILILIEDQYLKFRSQL